MVSGDVTTFPNVYFNDSEITLNDDYRQIIEDAGPALDDVLANLAPEQANQAHGMLSAQVAIILHRQENQAAWAAAQERAAEEGRNATLADMPNGEVPYEPKYEDQWVDVPFFVFDGTVDGNHAEVKLAYEPPKSAALVTTYTLSLVEGNWYISNVRGEYRAEPEELPPGMEVPIFG